MSSTNIQLVQQIYGAFGRRDVAAMKSLLNEDFTVEQSTQLPWGGHYDGFDGLLKFFTALTSHVDSQLVFDRFLDAGDHVVVIGWTRGKTVKGIQPFDVPVAHVWKITNDRLTAFRPYIDNPTMLKSLI